MAKYFTRRAAPTGTARCIPALIAVLLPALSAWTGMPAAQAANISTQGASLVLSVPDYWSGTGQTSSAGVRVVAVGTNGAAPRQNSADGATLALHPMVLPAAEAGTVAVPAVTGLSQTAAATALASAGLVAGGISQAYHATIPAGGVIAQNPVAGAFVAPGTAVALTVSKGPAPAEGELEGEGEPQTEGESEGEPVTPPTAEEARTQIAAAIDTVDSNGDGLVSFTEAVAALPGITRTVFDQLDINGDGSLDSTELGIDQASGCNCSKGFMTPGALKHSLSDLFMGGLTLISLLALSRRTP